MNVCLLWMLCVVRWRSPRRTDHSSRGVLPTVVRRCVWFRNLVNEEALTHWGTVVPKTKWQVNWKVCRRKSSCSDLRYWLEYSWSDCTCRWPRKPSVVVVRRPQLMFEPNIHANKRQTCYICLWVTEFVHCCDEDEASDCLCDDFLDRGKLQIRTLSRRNLNWSKFLIVVGLE